MYSESTEKTTYYWNVNVLIIINYVVPNCYPTKAVLISSMVFMLSGVHSFCSVAGRHKLNCE